MELLKPDCKHKLLSKIHRTGLPHRVIYFDTETKTKVEGSVTKHRMQLAWTCLTEYDNSGIITSEKWLLWSNSEEFCKYIQRETRSNKTVYLFAHNIFFDLQVSDFYYWFTIWGWKLKFYYEKGLVYILSIQKDKNKLLCLSSTNYFDTSLKKIGEFVDLPKLDIDFQNSSKDELIIYCKRDVEIVKKVMEYFYEFIRTNNLGRFCFTRASQSFTAFRHKFMNEKIYLHDSEGIRALERQAYYGGRVECFELGHIKSGPFVTLDINSQYPYVMINNEYPVKLISIRKNVDLSFARDILKTFCAVSEVIVNTDLPIYPIRQNGKLIFPIGTFKTYLCTRGLKCALERNHIESIITMAVYQKASIFDSYVAFFYALKDKYKQEDNDILTRMSKLFLNSLYGKFGQKKTLTEMIEDCTFNGYYRIDTIDLVTGEKEIEYKMFNKRVIEYGEEDGKQSFPAIASHITEDARLLLWQIIESTGIEHVLYCDTDSIKIRKKHLVNVEYPIDSYKLGALKIESENEDLEIIAPKCYITENERVLKGVPKVAVETHKDTFQYTTFLKQASHMKKRITRYFITKQTIKTLNRNYDKGIVHPDGRVTPFQFGPSLLLP